ncbi:hypothetical protein GW17_00059677 [Ensete ventricosum]|nr:hypothetical protein GW17_00059677 [Ensete ventricosum]
MVIYLSEFVRRDEFRSVFRELSQKFKILAIPDVLAHRKSYEHGFMKKCDGHKLCETSCAELSFDRFLCTVSEIQNTGHSRRISTWEVIQNTGHSQRISPWEVVRIRFHEKTRWS